MGTTNYSDLQADTFQDAKGNRLDRRRTAKVALGSATGNGGVLAWANPEGVPIDIEGVKLDVTTKTTGAATIDVGVAANGTTTADNLIDGQDIGTAAGLFSTGKNGGTNGKPDQRMTASQFVTGTASANPAGLVGYAYITYLIL